MIEPFNKIVDQRYLIEFLQQIYQYQDSLSLLIITFAYLQPLETNQAKNEIIREITKKIRESIRRDDCFAKLSSEEFVILLPFANTSAAMTVAQRLCGCIPEFSLIIHQHLIKLTISIGIASSQKTDENIDAILKRAKEALLLAKTQTTNGFIVHPIDLGNWLAHQNKFKN